jgi:hypothetical protein
VTLQSGKLVEAGQNDRGQMKRKRGRPKANGVRPGWVFLRESIALNAYDEVRRADQKHEAALDAMVEAVGRWSPNMPMSRTEAKRILADWRGKHRASTIIGKGEQILEGEAAACHLERLHTLATLYAELKGLPLPQKSNSTTVRICTFGAGTVPRYPRINRKEVVQAAEKSTQPHPK